MSAPSSSTGPSSKLSTTTAAQPAMPPPRSALERPRQLTPAGSSDSSDSESSVGVDRPALVRCLRCQRTLSGGPDVLLDRNAPRDLDWATNGDGRVRLGLNLYYCARCANMVGLKG